MVDAGSLERRMWGIVGLGALAVLVLYETLPERLPLLATFWSGAAVADAPRSLAMVMRIPAMGAGMVGAAAVLAQASRRQHAAPWQAFWSTLMVTAGLKATLETTQLVSLSTVVPTLPPSILHIAVLGVSGLGLALALIRLLRGRPRGLLQLRHHERVLLCMALATCLLSAATPKLLEHFPKADGLSGAAGPASGERPRRTSAA